MKLYEAKDLIKDVFEHAFDKDRYTRLIKNLLKDFEEKTFTYQGNIIPNAFENYIRTMERIGKFKDKEGNSIDILVVELKREHSIEYARSAQRNFVRWYLSGSRGGQMKDAALVAFHSAKYSEWRFSLIKMQYSLETKKDEFTPAKRFSFLVGEKGKSHTAQRQLVKLLKSDDIPLLSDLEEAFNIESVTNEFFEKYKALAFNLVEELENIIERDATVKNEFESKNIAVIDFAKKLMGQIVFLYFLQRKGWLGLKNGERYGDGDRNFLRSLYVSYASSMSKSYQQDDHDIQNNFSGVGNTHRQDASDTKPNFFNDYLEYLFYEALSKKRVTDEYARFNCRIPFLNGGLFDPINFYDWEKTDIIIPDHLFTNDNKTKEGDTGDGILDIFDLYNFTVNEAEPLDKEVAVDPEMLGKVFERMLDVKERKSKGAFYTPREIVHYMSQESLIHYLDTVVNQSSRLINNSSRLINNSSSDKVYSQRSSSHENNEADHFLYFDPDAPVEKKHRNLPHWQQKGVAYFVTFRLYDSIPKAIAEKIKIERNQWFEKNNITDPAEIKSLPKEKRIEYHKLFSKRYDKLLDNGHGSCVLAQSKCYRIVENAIKYFEGKRYELDEFAIQPNHVHCIVIPKGDWTLSQITHSWKSYTANEINKILGREGTLWMAESFDHIIRSERQLERIRKYIINQASSLSAKSKQHDKGDSGNHRQDVCDTVPKKDIEILIKHGEQLIDKDAAILEGKLKESANTYHIPESIRKHAKEIDKALEDVRVCDPAVGSGAFPVGVMTEIVKARQILTPFVTHASSMMSMRKDSDIRLEARSTYAFKSHCIHHNLYGVDIDPSAVEICKLRLWLSLVVDEQRIDMIEPLPNLDYKIVRGNSLINMPEDVFPDDKLKKQINDLMEKYYAETDKQAKRELKDEIDGKIKQLLKSAEQFTNYPIDFDFKLFFHEVFKEKGGFDVVIGNPPYVSTKGTNSTDKNALKKTYGFADDLYSHFFFKSFEILKKAGVLTFITSNTFLTIGTKKNVRHLLQSKRIIELIKIADVFEAMVSPVITVTRNINAPENYSMIFKNALNDFENPERYSIEIDVYRNAVNSVFFPPTELNMKFYSRYNAKIKQLYNEWWPRIETSKKITQNTLFLEKFRQSLKPGDLSLLGTLTEGGQGLATANNGRFVGVKEDTKQAKSILKTRPIKLLEAVKSYKIPLNINSKEEAILFLNKKSENEIRQLFDKLKEKYGRDIFGQGYLYRIVSKNEIADVNKLTEDEKKNGIEKSKPHYVPYDKGDKDGNRWYLETPFVLDWSKEAVKWFYKNSGKKGQGMPVVRNPQFYFREGFCWTDVNSTYLKCRIKENGIHDVLSMSLFSITDKMPEYYIISLINSKFISKYVDDFINNTSHFQINDARQLPIIIPTKEKLQKFKQLFDKSIGIKKKQFSGTINKSEADKHLEEIQNQLDEMVYKLYFES